MAGTPEIRRAHEDVRRASCEYLNQRWLGFTVHTKLYLPSHLKRYILPLFAHHTSCVRPLAFLCPLSMNLEALSVWVAFIVHQGKKKSLSECRR